jgi:hypothetical protein
MKLKIASPGEEKIGVVPGMSGKRERRPAQVATGRRSLSYLDAQGKNSV